MTDHSEGFSSTLCDESHPAKATSSHLRLVPFAGTCLPSGVIGRKPTCQVLSNLSRWAHSVRRKGSSVFLEPWASVGSSSPSGLTLPHLTAGGSCLLGCLHALGTVRCLLGLLHAGPMLGPNAVGLVMLKLGLFWGGVYRPQTCNLKRIKGITMQPPSGWRERILS